MGNLADAEIVKAARRHGCNLIVIASHGRRGFSRLLLGSVTSKVLAQSPIPVMVVR
jgi:nucleotide-binding universal stress UspA family protein